MRSVELRLLQGENDLDILALGLCDTAEDVRIEAVISMPVILMWSGFGSLNHIFKRLEILEKEAHGLINKVIPGCLAYFGMPLWILYNWCTKEMPMQILLAKA